MKKTKILIKEINEGKNLKENLPMYREHMANTSCDAALLNLIMEYFTWFETMVDGWNPELPEVEDMVVRVQNTVNSLFVKLETDKGRVKKDLENIRKDLEGQHEVITAYIDRFEVFFEVMKKFMLRYEDPKKLDKQKEEFIGCEEKLVQEIIGYVFIKNDASISNERIKEILKILPVRITKSKFYDLLSQSLTVYKGSDQSALDRFLYMVQTTATLYEPEGMKEYFTSYKDLVLELEKADYKGMTKETYYGLRDRLDKEIEELYGLSDVYVSLSLIVNNLLAYTFLNGWERIGGMQSHCKKLLQRVYGIIEEKKWDEIPYETFDELEDSLYYLEGDIEKAEEERLRLESVLEQIISGYPDVLDELSLTDPYQDLANVQKLFSGSAYVDLDEKGKEEKVDDAYVKQCTANLIERMDNRFTKMQRPVIRVVMAKTLSLMPFFFQTAEDLQAYLTHSLKACTDTVEKVTCILELWSKLKEDKWETR